VLEYVLKPTGLYMCVIILCVRETNDGNKR